MIRVYIGTQPEQKLACEVLKYSIRARASEPVSFFEITDKTNRHAMTGFSFARWHVPQLAKENGDGVAIYMDADIVVLGDIAALANVVGDKPALARPTSDGRYFTSVMRLDCAQLAWDVGGLSARFGPLKSDSCFVLPEWLHNAIMWAAANSPWRHDFGPLDARWNDLDLVKAGTQALHYTDLKRQPWRYAGHPFGYVFQAELKSAIADKAVSMGLVAEEIAKGHVRSDVLMVP
jgi:hypothetical protein